VGQSLEKVNRGTIGVEGSLDRFVMRLNRTTHFKVRSSERADRFVMRVEQRLKMPIQFGIH